MANYRAYTRPVAGRPNRAAEAELRRSHAAVPVAVAVVIVGLFLARYSLVLTALLGVVLLASGASLLSSRLNPLSASFYLTRKPSWTAVGVVFLGALILVGGAYELWVRGLAPIVPGA